MNYETLRFVIENKIARIVLARPESGNRVDARLLRELTAAAEAIAESDAVVVTLIEAEGAHFCRGWEPSLRDELLSRPSPAGLDTVDPFGPLASLACPVIVAVQGEVRSAGLELALTCDIRIAAHDARFSLPEVGEGILPLAGGSQRLPRIVGRGVAQSMLLLGDELDAASAYRAGLVSRVVPREELSAAAQALAERAASLGPVGLHYAKEAVTRGAEMTLDQGLRYETDLAVILQSTRDRAESVRAFLEKRPPHFEGR